MSGPPQQRRGPGRGRARSCALLEGSSRTALGCRGERARPRAIVGPSEVFWWGWQGGGATLPPCPQGPPDNTRSPQGGATGRGKNVRRRRTPPIAISRSTGERAVVERGGRGGAWAPARLMPRPTGNVTGWPGERGLVTRPVRPAFWRTGDDPGGFFASPGGPRSRQTPPRPPAHSTGAWNPNRSSRVESDARVGWGGARPCSPARPAVRGLGRRRDGGTSAPGHLGAGLRGGRDRGPGVERRRPRSIGEVVPTSARPPARR